MKKLIIISFILLTAGLSSALIAQEVKINSNFAIEADGTFRLDGDATVWDDMQVSPDATSKNGSNAPAYNVFINDGGGSPPTGSQGVFLYWFSAGTEQELYFTVQIPHSYKVGSTLYPHVHWITSATAPTRDNVVWGLEYTAIQLGTISSATTTKIYTSATTGIISDIVTPNSKMHLITALPSISGTNLEISTILICRLFRAVGDAKDVFADPAGLLSFDIHYEKNTEGSRTQYTK